MKPAILLAMLSLAATAPGAAFELNADMATLLKEMPSGIELMWWTFSGINAGIVASTPLPTGD